MIAEPTRVAVGPVRGRSRRVTVTAGLVVLAAALFVLAVGIGSVPVPVGEVLRALVGEPTADPTTATIVRLVRLPRALTAVLAGAALGVAGLQMQTLFRNPLADPFVLGISSGASLGVALVTLGSTGAAGFLAGLPVLGSLRVAGAAIAGAAVLLSVVLVLARRVRSAVTVLIVGIMAGYVATSVVSLLVYFADPEDFREYIAWSLGSFRGVTWQELRVLAPTVLAGLTVAAAATKPLNALLLGERYAESMGLSVTRARVVTIASASILAGVVTAYAGPIAFIGLAVPHLARMALGSSDHRVLMPAVVALGAVTALTAELAGQVPGSPIALPINAVTPIIGAPVVVVVLLRMRRTGSVVT